MLPVCLVRWIHTLSQRLGKFILSSRSLGSLKLSELARACSFTPGPPSLLPFTRFIALIYIVDRPLPLPKGVAPATNICFLNKYYIHMTFQRVGQLQA